MASIRVSENQSLFDVAIQRLGSCEAAFELALLNGISLTDEPAAGQNLILSPIVNESICSYYAKKGLVPATFESEYRPHDGTIETKYWSNDYLPVLSNAKVAEGQTIFDVAIQRLGSCEAAFKLALLNKLSVTDELTPGLSLMLPEPWDNDIFNYYTNKALIPRTEALAEENEILNEGIGYWAIDVDFIVS